MLVKPFYIHRRIYVCFKAQAFAVFKYIGSNEFIRLYFLLRQKFTFVRPIFKGFIPLYIIVKTNDISKVIDYMNNIDNETEIKFDLQFHKKGKYDEYIPEQLLKKAYLKNYLERK